MIQGCRSKFLYGIVFFSGRPIYASISCNHTVETMNGHMGIRSKALIYTWIICYFHRNIFVIFIIVAYNKYKGLGLGG